MKKANPSLKTTLIVEPTWSNHDLLLRYLGFDVIKLPYYKAGNFDFASYTAASRAAPWGSVVVLHSCAHNPTRCDPSMEQWKEIVAVIAQKCMFPIFDPAYLGFNSGNVYEDACAIRYFIEGLKMGASVYLSFAKSMRIYGERMGLVIFATNSQDTTRVINSILENVQRATVCSPPVYGAQIAGAVLNNPAIVKQWGQDLITMGHQKWTKSSRIHTFLRHECLRSNPFRHIILPCIAVHWRSGRQSFCHCTAYLHSSPHVANVNVSRIS